MTERVRTCREGRVGGLAVVDWAGDGPVILGLPGLGSTGWSWSWLAEQLPDARLVAPDLCGRGGSAGLGGPGGLARHAVDVRRVAEELDLRDVVIVGHSMGAFLAPLAARELAGRVDRVVLIDGGIPPKQPWFMTPLAVRLLFRAGLKKLAGPWPDVETFTRELGGKALRSRPELVPLLAELARHDLVAGPDGKLRPRLDRDLIVGDALDTFFGAGAGAVQAGLEVPTHLLWCTSGRHDGARPMYTANVVEEWRHRLPALTSERVAANHVTLLWTPQVVAAVRGKGAQ
ncbi:MAG: alpha/beta fold hydrolase [Mycobacteriales bacterium]